MSNKFNPKARAEEIARQLREAEEAKKAYDQSIESAVRDAGRTRVEFVEMIYDFFGIEPEKTPRKDKDGKVVRTKAGDPVMVSTDKDESVRIARLATAFEKLVTDYERRGGKVSGATVMSNEKPTLAIA